MSPRPPMLLVVDDEELNRDLLSRRLRKAGFEAVTAADGHEALALVARGGIDLVLLDIMMPGVSGLEVLRRLRADEMSAKLPIIMVTAKVQPEDVVGALELGADDYVTKPVNFAVALARIRTQLAKRRAELALLESEERYSLAVEGTNDGVWDWRIATGDLYCSPRWREVMGLAPDAQIADFGAWMDRLHPADRDRVRSDVQDHLDDRRGWLESESRVRIGETFRWILIRGKAVRDAAGRAVRIAGSVTDITGGKVADALTGLPNRVLFDDRLVRLFEYAKRVPGFEFAVLFLDLDRFKNVNDCFGHGAGDQLLAETARRLEHQLRAADSLSRFTPTDASSIRAAGHTIGRLGGDEFGIILGGVRRPADATYVAERLVAAVAEPMRIDGQQIVPSASIGISLSATGYDRPGDMLRDADTALYRAKAAGRGRYELFDATMREDVLRTVETEAGLREALSAGTLLLHYQPIVEVAHGRVTGYEALLRWQHPVRGMVMPGEFIGIAEDTGLIVPIGYWVVGEVCRQLCLWAEQDGETTPPVVAVNLSRRQLQMEDFVDRVTAIVDEAGVPRSGIEFELTESAIMADPDQVRAAIERLKHAGFRISIDDFGTGYSSLSALQRLSVDRLKIDRSFLEDVAGDTAATQVMEGIMLLADHLKLEVVAEGIETVEHLTRIQTMHCQYGQGYLFSRPVPPGPSAARSLPGDWRDRVRGAADPE